jgi:hypothetical protein
MNNIKNLSPTQNEMWTAKSQIMLDAIRPHLNHDEIKYLTAGQVLEVLHDNTGSVSQETKLAICGVLSTCAGHEASPNGVYHYVFIRQLEYLCETLKKAHEMHLIH